MKMNFRDHVRKDTANWPAEMNAKWAELALSANGGKWRNMATAELAPSLARGTRRERSSRARGHEPPPPDAPRSPASGEPVVAAPGDLRGASADHRAAPISSANGPGANSGWLA